MHVIYGAEGTSSWSFALCFSSSTRRLWYVTALRYVSPRVRIFSLEHAGRRHRDPGQIQERHQKGLDKMCRVTVPLGLAIGYHRFAIAMLRKILLKKKSTRSASFLTVAISFMFDSSSSLCFFACCAARVSAVFLTRIYTCVHVPIRITPVRACV